MNLINTVGKDLKAGAKKLNSVTRNLYKKAMTDNHSKDYTRVGNQLYRKEHKKMSDKFLGK